MSGNTAAVLHRARDVRIEERPMPELGPREVLVKVRSVGVCGSDMHYYEHGRIGSFVVNQPLVLGHEVSGEIVELGDEVTRHEVGERVAIEPGVPCGRCAQCRHGRYNLCADVRFFGTPPIDGAFADYVTIHEDYAFPLPDELSDDAGALIEPLSVGIWACQKGQVGIGSRVLITGAGPIGNLAMQVARAAGATAVAVADVNDDRLRRSAALGADRTINTHEEKIDEGDDRFDVLLECTGNEGVTNSGILALRPAGTAVLVGMGPRESAALPVAAMQAREIWVTGTFRYANTYPGAIDLAASGKVQLDGVVDGHFPLHDTEAALVATRDDPALLKVVVSVAADGAQTR